MQAPRPSLFPAWSKCPCYESAPAGEAANRGTKQHEYLHQLLTSNERSKMLGLEPDEIEAVNWAYNEIVSWANGSEKESEIKLQYCNNEFEPIFEGTADAISGTHLFDYKSGECRDYKPQLYAYALMMFERNPKLESITAHLLYGKVKSDVRFEITRAEAQRIIESILASRNNQDRKPTACEYCKWCLQAATCPALVEPAKLIAAEPSYSSEIKDPEEMSKALRMARLLKVWCDSVEFHAKEMALKSGQTIPGFKLKERSGKRFIDDIVKACQLSKLPAEEFIALCEIGIGKLEKKLGKKAASDLLGPVISKTASTFSLLEDKQETTF